LYANSCLILATNDKVELEIIGGGTTKGGKSRCKSQSTRVRRNISLMSDKVPATKKDVDKGKKNPEINRAFFKTI
jgi:hypothetical protein